MNLVFDTRTYFLSKRMRIPFFSPGSGHKDLGIHRYLPIKEKGG
jgi:hypothetical protein